MSASPILQSVEFEAALRATGQRPTRLPCGTLMLHRRIAGVPVAMLPRVTPGADSLRNLPTRAPVLISPNAPTTLRALPLVTPATQAVLRLDAARHDRLHGKWRNALRRGESHTLRVTRGPLFPDHWLLPADAQQQRARRYRGWPPGLTQTYTQIHPNQATVFEAFQDDTPIAAMLFLRHGDTATYHIGHTTPAGRASNAHNVLMWRAIQWLGTRGYQWLDLGLIDTETAPGLARFKLGTGARARTLGGTWLAWPALSPRILRPSPRHIRTNPFT